MNHPSTKRLLSAVSLIAVSQLFAVPSFAQTETQQVEAQDAAAADDGEAIIITGSRIPRRVGFEGAQPANQVDSEQIEQRGYTNLADALEELPSFGVPGSSPVGAASQAGEFGSGQNYVDFFGLGDQRTLTVANGRRFVSTNTASIFGPTGTNGSQVDFNIFPTLLIDRIEVIAVGGAPIYGSDAIAGTINVITKRDFQGVQLDAQYGISQRGDAAEWRIRGAAGTNFAGDRGNVALSVEYNKAEGLRYTDRRNHRLNSFFVAPFDDSPFGNIYIEDRRINNVTPFGVPQVSDLFTVLSPTYAAAFGEAFELGFPLQTGVTDNLADPLSGNPLAFDPSGNLVPIDFGKPTGSFFTSNGGNGFELPGSLLAERNRINALGLAQYKLTDNIRVFGEAWYSRSKGIQFTGQPEYSWGLFGSAGEASGPLVLRLDNPFLSPQARDIIAANLANNPLTGADGVTDASTFLLARANTDIISGVASSTVNLYRFVGGIDGTFEAFGRDMRFELVNTYGRSKTKGSGRAIVFQNLQNALDAVVDGSGNIVCRPGYTNAPVGTISSTCAPLNPFGQNVSQAARDYITAITNPEAKNTQWVVTASVSGSLFDLPGGAVDFVLGYEHRKETAAFDPGVFYSGGPDPDPLTDENGDGDPTNDRQAFGGSVVMDPVSGSFNTNEFFAELKLPLIGPDQNIPLVDSFEVNGAFRYIKHSLAGGDPTYTIGASWRPIKAITFRGNFTRSVRSPAITEYFNPRSSVFNTADDPCDVRFLNAGPSPATRQANCAAAGLAPDFVSNIVDATAEGTFSGNPNLVNETANSWTVGAVVRPTPRLTISADWVNIKVKNAVEGLSFTNILNACYDSPDYPNVTAGSGASFCNLITRDEFGQVTNIDTAYENAAQRRFAGLLAEVQWRLPTPFLGAASSINLGVNYLYNHKLELQVAGGDLDILRGGIGYSKHQATLNATYRNNGFSWQWQAQYFSKALNDPNAELDTYEFPTVGSVIFFNTSIAYELNDRFRLTFVVDNVFDKKQPFPVPAGGGTTTYFDGILGRYFKIGAGIKF